MNGNIKWDFFDKKKQNLYHEWEYQMGYFFHGKKISQNFKTMANYG